MEEEEEEYHLPVKDSYNAVRDLILLTSPATSVSKRDTLHETAHNIASTNQEEFVRTLHRCMITMTKKSLFRSHKQLWIPTTLSKEPNGGFWSTGGSGRRLHACVPRPASDLSRTNPIKILEHPSGVMTTCFYFDCSNLQIHNCTSKSGVRVSTP